MKCSLPCWLSRFLLLAAAYYFSGRLGLLLTVPPGQATAIWPASGIALAGLIILGPRYWPAILIGAVGTSLYHPPVIDLQAILIAIIIASGSTLQALLGYYLVRQHMQSSVIVLEKISEIGKLLFYGGAVGCLISASIATLTLYLVGFVAGEGLPLHWFTWWAGDVIGVTVFTPILLLLFSNRQEVSRDRKLAVSSAMAIAFSVVIYLFFTAKNQMNENNFRAFEDRAAEVSQELRRTLEAYLHVLVAIERFIVSSDYVSAEEFDNFTHEFLHLYPGIQALSWNRKVTRSQRPAYEQEIRRQGYPEFMVRDRNKKGALIAAARRELYFPVTYTQPYHANRRAHGFDTYGPDSHAGNLRRQALDRARDEGLPITTGRIPVIQHEQTYSLLVYHPVYHEPPLPTTTQQRSAALQGYVAGIFLLPDPLLLTSMPMGHKIHLIIRDRSAPPEISVLYDSRTPDHKESGTPIPIPHNILKTNLELTFAGHRWELEFLDNSSLIGDRTDWTLWAVLVGGLAFTGLFGVFMLHLTARTETVERMVAEKTAQLSATARVLEESNEELERFAYVASHDLRAPLRAIDNLSHWLEEDLAAILPEQSRDHMEKLRARVRRMEKLLEDLLQYSRVGRKSDPGENEIVTGAQLMENILGLLAPPEGFHIAWSDAITQLSLPRMPLQQVLLNLINNAIKHHHLAEGNISVEVVEEGSHYLFSVTDDGPGIAPQFQRKIFDMFQTLRPRDEVEGSGMGLAMVQKIVKNRGGEIWVESQEGQGSQFCFTWPRQSERTGAGAA